MNKHINSIFGLIAALLCSCGGRVTEVDNTTPVDNTQQKTEKQLLKAHQHLVRMENEIIENFLHRYQWNMERTGTGLRYQIYQQGKGNLVQTGQTVTLKYKLFLLTGDLIYSSDSTGVKEFKVGKGSVEAGLEEGILKLHKGDKARLIIPSHLAYGTTGDGNLIPAKAPILYDLEVIDTK